jgi:CHAT domain-containing protein
VSRRLASALGLALTAFACSHGGSDHPETARRLTELAATEVWAEGLDRSLGLAEVRWVNNVHVLGLGPDAEIVFQDTLFIDRMDTAVTVELRDKPCHPRVVRLALTGMLRDNGRAVDFSVIGRRQRRLLGAEVQGLFTRLSELYQEQEALGQPKAGAGALAANEPRLAILAAEIRELEGELARRGAGEVSEIPDNGLGAVQEALPPEAALIEFVVYRPQDTKTPGKWGPPRYMACVLRSTDEPQVVDLGSAAVIDRAVETFRRVLAQPWTDPTAAGRELDILTEEKLRPLLGNARTLFVIPDGDLILIPFAALVDERGRYLVERYRISYLFSVRELLPEREEPCGHREPPLVVGGPDFSAPVFRRKLPIIRKNAGDAYPVSVDPLSGAAAEAAAIGTLLRLPPARILTGSLATETAIKAVHGPRILHLATHGFFLPDLPAAHTPGAAVDRMLYRARETREEIYLRSGVALTGYNRRKQARGPDDGLLTALEVMDLDLCGTELVTLSACETGLGEAHDGQGVFGLRRALALAGARSQLLTLWKLADDATKDLMVSFYAQVQQGVPFAEALRRMQLAALRQESLPATDAHARGVRPLGGPDPGSAATLAHPYYWASFILSGNAEHALESNIEVTE